MTIRAKSWTATIFDMEHFNSELLQSMDNAKKTISEEIRTRPQPPSRKRKAT
ncbi:unnamed protein product [Brugia pahangi]|uniref:Reverse transcriptase domain-containing protein n=1 Tax=Brugia pahangi TaxID=6280 RepID=A0A0N4TCQ2_BRUPA|nr:unnamed protein product [Brugia pahangi]